MVFQKFLHALLIAVGVSQAQNAGQLPGPISAAPASGNTANATLTLTFNDPQGYQDLTVVNALINNALDGRAACYVAVVPSTGSVFLVDNAGDSGGPYTGFTLPGSSTASNGQCTLNGAASSVSGSGNTLTLTLAIAFNAAFGGNKVVYLAARDTAGNNSGWQALGTWNVPGSLSPVGPSVVGVTPANGVGTSGTYTFTFADTNGFQDLSVTNVLINSAIDGRHACYMAYVPSGAGAGMVFLVDDAGSSLAGLPIPSVLTVSNSQCTISGQGSGVVATGNTLALTLAIAFKPAFSANQVIYLAAANTALNSGWQALGTVSAVVDAAAPAITALDPSSVRAGFQNSLSITVSGSNFQDVTACPAFCGAVCQGRSVVAFDHVNVPTTFISSTQVQALVPATQFTTARTADVTANNPVTIQCQGSQDHFSAPLPFTILP